MTQESPNLKIIADNAVERRRVPRLAVTNEQFRHGESGKVFSVIDLSTEGLAVRIIEREDLLQFPLASVVEGTLNLRGEKYPVKFRVQRIGQERIGGQFEGLSAKTRKALQGFFDPASLGQELRPMPGGEQGALWYHGPSGTDLLIWRSLDGSCSRFTLFVMSSYIQWDEAHGPTTGATSGVPERTEERGFVRLETLALTPDSQPDPGKLDIAKTVVLSSNLPQDLRRWCALQLTVT